MVTARSIARPIAAVLMVALAATLTGCASSQSVAGRAERVVSQRPATVTVMATNRTTARVTVTEVRTAAPVATTTDNEAPGLTTTATARKTLGAPADSGVRGRTSQAFDVVNRYWTELFETWSDPNGLPIQWIPPSRYNGDGFYDSATGYVPGCAGNYDNVGNAFFCGNVATGTGFVAWDLQLMETESDIGDAVPFAIVGHEVGHAAQTRFIHDDQAGAVPSSLVGLELQADCLAGAALGKAHADGYLDLGTAGLQEISVLLESVGDYAGSHGTPAERDASFYIGYNGDIESCLFNRGVPPPGWIGPG